MPAAMPATKPRMSFDELMKRIEPLGFEQDKNPVFMVGVRGYYKDTMGAPAVNDRGIYDDAIFLVSPSFFGAYNGNTDPSKHRAGTGFGAKKGMASLMPGSWACYRFGMHKANSPTGHFALCQRAGKVTVMRDGNPPYQDTGDHFGINIHRGGRNTTSSEGCQTIHPSQWDSFIASAEDQARRFHGVKWKTTTLTYMLIEA